MIPPEKIRSSDVALKGANDYLCIHIDTRILKYTIQCVQKIRKYLLCTQNGQNGNRCENDHSLKKIALLMWLLRELMIPYAYLETIENSDIPYSVSNKSESTFFALKMAKM